MRSSTRSFSLFIVDFHEDKTDDASDDLLLALCRRELVPCHELCRDVVRNSEVLAPRLAADRMHGLAHIVVDFGRCGAAESRELLKPFGWAVRSAPRVACALGRAPVLIPSARGALACAALRNRRIELD